MVSSHSPILKLHWTFLLKKGSPTWNIRCCFSLSLQFNTASLPTFPLINKHTPTTTVTVSCKCHTAGIAVWPTHFASSPERPCQPPTPPHLQVPPIAALSPRTDSPRWRGLPLAGRYSRKKPPTLCAQTASTHPASALLYLPAGLQPPSSPTNPASAVEKSWMARWEQQPPS